MEPNSIHIGSESNRSTSNAGGQMPNPKKKVGFMAVLNDYLIRLQSIKISDKVSFFRLLATMINAGVSIVKALEILKEQMENKHMKLIISDIITHIESGSSFSKSISAYPKYFSESQVGMVEAGEATGRLNQTLLQIADEIEKEAAFRSRIKGAMIYPIVIIGVTVAAFVLVMVVVMPKIKNMFTDLGGELPALTQSLIDLSDFLLSDTWGISNILLIIIIFAAIIFSLMRWKKTRVGARLWTRFVFRMPLFGKLSKKASLAQFCRSLSTMVGSGIPIIKALQITATSVGNPVYQSRIYQIAEDVKQGISMAENMKDDTYYFPSMVVGMIGVAEQTAQMDAITEKMAKYYEEEVDSMVKGLSSLMEPLIMIVIGAGVGFLVVAVMEPILSASDLAV